MSKKNNEEMLSVEDALERAQKGADALEDLINRFNDEPGISAARHEELVAHFMSLLAEAEGIAPDSTEINATSAWSKGHSR